MSSRRRITIALVGLIALVVVGWFARHQAGGSEQLPRSGASIVSSAGAPVAASPPSGQRGAGAFRDLGVRVGVSAAPDKW